jgi:hypothetical protein
MAAVFITAVATVGVALLLAMLLPGAGFIAAVLVVLIGIAVIAWLVLAGGTRQTPSDISRRTEEHEFLGPGGPDDPNR